MTKLPALHFYPGDWKKDLGVQALEFFDRQVWFEMLLLMHDSEERGVLLVNGKPPNEEALARLIGLDKQILSKSLANIKDNGVCGVRDDGAFFSRRMVRDEEIRQKRVIAGSMGGNPILVKQNSSKKEAKPEHVPEDENANVNEDESISKKKTVEKLLIGKYTKITSEEHQKFLSTWGADETAYWLATFDLAYEQNPAKFCKQYSNHAAAIRNWRKRALEDGKVWDKTRKLYLHPRNSSLNLQGAKKWGT